MPPLPAELFAGFPNRGGVTLRWVGPAGGRMIEVRGPLNGWGVQNLYLDGNNLAGVGIHVLSASSGSSSNLALTNFTDAALVETTLPSFAGFGLANAMHNSWTNTSINVPAVYGAKAIVETGQPASTPQVTNACYNLFRNTTIYLPATQTTFGIYLQWTDSLLFEGTHIFGGSAKATAVMLDYGKQNNMPSSCGFVGIDASGNGTTVAQWANAGTPGPGARPNWVKGVGEINLGVQPSLPNLLTDMPARVRNVDTVGATSQIANAPLHTPYITGMFRASFYIRMTAAGTAGTITPRITVNDGVGAVNLDGSPVNATGGATWSTVTFRAQAGFPVNYSTVFAGVTGTPAYNLALTLERLS